MNQATSSGKTAMVTGGAGFLGSHLCDRLLEQGMQVICVDSLLTGSMRNIAHLENITQFRFIKQDVCEPLDIKDDLDFVYNLACAASPPRYQADPIHTMMTSVQGTLNLLMLAEAKGARFLQASTSEVYGDPDRHPQAEDYHGNVNCTGPRACYDEGKRAAESLCFDFLRLGRADVRVMRIFNTYGPRMDPDDGRIVSNLVVQALRGQPLTIYGTGEQTRSFCYVSDLIAGMMALMTVAENPKAPVNIGNPGEFTINELAKLVVEQTGTSSETVFKPLPVDDPTRRRPDISRAKALLNWEPTVPLEKGLRDTIAHFRERVADEKGHAA
ncbi:SDR family oxidoreductase [Tianweitania sp. BSSL-BM11]|uniref:SDR family oxidoreductase n=1 Tax=Tianweitania aestuarii TaxID=2814886 RepID=A0ABS5RXZ7_9HYPH|nr:UDP-glucuronic acid decarboxylase family protein [Tianweitania aestuarii]MBS9721888.1 SDR family oxidoreductase [Tianweitania aestuarii]